MSLALTLSQISKSYGSQRVLSDVSLEIEAGTVVSLIGENGAGKSTLAKIVSGITCADAGSMMLFGTQRSFSHPAEALAAGVGMVHQEISLLDNLTVAENICLGREPLRNGWLDKPRMLDISDEALRKLSLSIDPSRRVGTLSLAQKQIVEIARTLAHQAKLIIFDEPSSSLSESDAQHLLSTISSLRCIGVTCLYISHRLSEVMQISDRVIALRDGSISGECSAPSLNRQQLIACMIGRELRDMYDYSPRQLGEPALELSQFQASHKHSAFDLSVRAGEIVGVAGLIGSGRTEFLEAVYGIRKCITGSIRVRGLTTSITSPADALLAGIALAPESRKEQGILGAFSISDTIALTPYRRGSSAPVSRSAHAESTTADRWISELQVNCLDREQSVSALSGGNQQKVILARCLESHPTVLLLDEPTRGIDIGARRAIYQLLFSLARQGLAILFVSSELDEVMGIADRALVMSEGRMMGELERKDFSEHAFMHLASPHREQPGQSAWAG
jgi:ribose transport system ATP-binding protein